MSKPAAASLRYLLPNVSFTDSLWHMALTVQPPGQISERYYLLSLCGKGHRREIEEEGRKKKGGGVEQAAGESCAAFKAF